MQREGIRSLSVSTQECVFEGACAGGGEGCFLFACGSKAAVEAMCHVLTGLSCSHTTYRDGVAMENPWATHTAAPTTPQEPTTHHPLRIDRPALEAAWSPPPSSSGTVQGHSFRLVLPPSCMPYPTTRFTQHTTYNQIQGEAPAAESGPTGCAVSLWSWCGSRLPLSSVPVRGWRRYGTRNTRTC